MEKNAANLADLLAVALLLGCPAPPCFSGMTFGPVAPPSTGLAYRDEGLGGKMAEHLFGCRPSFASQICSQPRCAKAVSKAVPGCVFSFFHNSVS